MADDIEARIHLIEEFKRALELYQRTTDPKVRAWLNQNVHRARQESIEAGTHQIMRAFPPPAIGGPVMTIDPFDYMFERVYLRSMVPQLLDILDKTIGVLRAPPKKVETKHETRIEAETQRGYAFVAMPMDKDDHKLVDVLEAIKAGAKECGVTAERIDEDERNERITDRMLESISKAEFVIVDLTSAKPNVFFEAGYAHGMGKIPIYVAHEGTQIHFDVKDYPIIFFKNMKELREGVAKRLHGIAEKRVAAY